MDFANKGLVHFCLSGVEAVGEHESHLWSKIVFLFLPVALALLKLVFIC